MIDEGKVRPRDVTAHLVAMITESNDSSRAWVQFYIAVQSGLAVGTGAAVAFWQSQGTNLGPVFGLIPAGLSLLGAMLGLTVCRIIVRAHKWQSWFAMRLNELTSGGENLNLYPTEKGVIDAIQLGHNARMIERANRTLVAVQILSGLGIMLIILVSLSGG